MDEKYLQDLYDWIKSKDASFEGRYSYQDFVNNMQNDDYVNKMHNWISQKDNTFSQRHPIDEFISRVKLSTQEPVVEKKSPIVSSATPQEVPTDEQGTTDLSSEGTSSASSSQPDWAKLQEQRKYADVPQGQGRPFQLDLSNIKPQETALPEDARKGIKEGAFRFKDDKTGEDYSLATSETPEKYINAFYGQYGFSANRNTSMGGMVNNLTITNPQGKSITVPINNISDSKNNESIVKIEEFIKNSPKATGVRKDIQEGALPVTKKSIDLITPELISGTEEKAVPLMQYHFGDLGFKFEESGATGDWMTVTAPDGTQTEFSLDNWTSSKDASEAQRLKNFIINKSSAEKVSQIEQKSVGENAKVYSDKEAQETLKKLNEEFNSMVKERDLIVGENRNADKLLEYLNSIPADQRDAAWNEKYVSAMKSKEWVSNAAAELEAKRASANQREAQIQSSLGKYYSMKGEQGTWYGNKWSQIVDAFSKAGAGMQQLKFDIPRSIPIVGKYVDDLISVVNYGQKDKSIEYRKDFIDVAKSMNIQIPEGVESSMDAFNDWKNSIAFGDARRDEIDKKVFNNLIKSNKQGINETIINGYKSVNDPNTTTEYTDLSKKGFWGGAIAGLIDFAPAMIGGPINKAANMFAISNENMMQEFNNNPAFKDVSEDDKMLYALPFNLANSVLLEFGLNRVMGNKSFVANLVTSSLKKAGAEATAVEIKNAMKGEVNNMIAKGAIDVTKGTLSGAELGVAMYSTDVAIKQAINEMKGKDMLETPKSAGEFIKGAAQSAASLAAGAGIISSFHAVGNAGKETGYKGMSDDMFDLFELAANNSAAQDAFVTDLKNKVSAGEMTTEQAKETLNTYRNSVGLFRELPDHLDTRAKKEAMDLLKEKRDLENKIKDKDPALVKPQQERINKINEQLTKLSEDAIQKQTADEALLRAGEQKLGLQKVGEGDTESKLTPEQEQLVADEKAHYQELLDNPEDETDLERAKNYFANPVAYLEEQVKFWEDLTKEDPTEQSTLDYVKKVLEAHKAAEVKPESTTITVGAGGATATTSGGPTEVTTGGEGTETATSGTDIVKTKKNEDNEHVVTLNGEEVGNIYYDPSQKTWNNANFSRAGEKPYTAKWIYGDVLGESKQQAIDEVIKRHKESAPKKEEPQKVQYTKDNILNRFLNKLNELNPLQKNPIDNKSFVYGDKASLEFNRFDKGDKNEVALESIMSLDKNKGAGSAVMKDITAAADALGVKLTLDAKPFGREGLTKQQLVDFYKKNGFKVDFEDAYGGEFKSEQELLDYALQHESETIPMSREPKTSTEIKAGESVGVSEGKPTEVTTGGEGPETKTSTAEIDKLPGYEEEMGKVDLLVPKYKEYVDRDLNKAKDKLKIAKKSGSDAKIEEAKKALEKAKAAAEEYKKEVADKKEEALEKLQESDMYKNADDIQKDALAREVANRFGEKQKSAPTPEELFGNVAEAKEIMNEMNFLFDDANKSKNYLEQKYKEAKAALDKNPTSETLKKNLQDAIAELKEYETKNIGEAITRLRNSKIYQDATKEQREKMENYLKDKFLKSQKESLLATELLGTKPKPENITMSGKELLKEQIKAFARGAKAGVQGIRESITQIVDYVKGTDINTKDLKKVMDVLKSKIETESDLNKAIEKVFDIVDKSNEDIIEISKTKVEKDKMKAELEGFKKGKKSVADRVKQIRQYFESVKEFGNLTRKDLSKVMREISKVKDEETLDKAVDKINAIIDKAKTDILEISELKMIKDKMKGIKDAKKDLNEKRKLIAAAIDFIQKSGNVSAKKVGKMLRDIGKVNLEDDTKIEMIIEYAEKVFEDAEYDNKLSAANSVRSAIKSLASNKKKNTDLSTFAKQFFKIRPFDVDNIDEYNEMAKNLKESLEGSKITKDKNNPIKLADMIDIAKMSKYVDNMLNGQAKIDKEKLITSARGIMGDDATFLSDDEVFELIKTGQVEKNEKVDDSLLKKITERVNKIFDSSSAMVDEMLRTGKDPLTGEDIDLSEGRKKIVERFMSMDMKDLSDREKLGVIDALNNFIRNGSVANMETVYADYKAKDSLAKAIENNLVAKKLKLFFSKKTGRAFGQQISTLPNLTEQMFRGVTASEEFKRLSGITELVNKKAAVQRTMNVLTDSFIKEFYNQKANGKAFDTAENVAERGVIADMKRDIAGTPEQQKYEFERKKKLQEKSIELLRDGNEQERKLAEIHQKVYDKLLKDSNSVDDVLKKSDDKNIEAVDWWIDKWAEIFDPLAELTESVYNEKLDRDLNYTNRKFSLLSGGAKAPELSSRESVFLNSNNDIFGKGVYKKKTGVLEKSTRPEADGMEDRYIDLSFDRNMINAYQDALMDINTAATVRRIESFFSSKAIKKIIPNKEDRDLLFRNNGKEGVIPDLIRTTRQRQVVQTDELTSVFRKLSNLGTAGAATALAGVSQPFKQTIPVAVNTFINAGKLPDFFYFRNKDKVDFINNSQRAIAIRGGKSRVSVDSINRLAEAAATSKASRIIDFLGKANEFALKALVEKPDVWIAKASWITYYEKGLKMQGDNPNKIDWKKHEINEKAADYAQDMVDRQQNISDADLQGKLMNTKDPLKSVMVKAVMPFASFRMNQTMRMYSDWKTLFSKKGSATKEDKITAFKSLSGYVAEMATFKYIQYFVASSLGAAAVKAMGINETDDDKKKREEMVKRSQITGTVTDILSPLPMLDLPVAIGVDKAMSYFQDLENIDDEDKYHLMTSLKNNGAKYLGLYGIAIDKANSIIEAFEISTTGEYTDEYGRKKYVSRQTADALGDIALMSVGSSAIGFPAEMNTILRNSLRLAKKNSSTKEPTEQAYQEEAEKQATKEEKAKDVAKKVSELNKMLEKETNENKILEIQKKINYLTADKEGKKYFEQINEMDKKKKEELLGVYDNEEDMKKYNPGLYEKNFGVGSDWYKEHKYEKMVEKDLNKNLEKQEEIEYNYSGGKKNKDGTTKRKSKNSNYSESRYIMKID